MSTVIIGGGVIGMSIAFYLTDRSSPNRAKDVHVIDSSATLFNGASGYAGGFLAKNWFSPVTRSLGLLSFELHKQLAKDYDGANRWGYMPSMAYSLDVRGILTDNLQPGGADWLRDGTSRSRVASELQDTTLTGCTERPVWLTPQKGGSVEEISDEGSVAQVDPLRLCQFLLRTCQSRGVQVRHSAQVTTVITDPETNAISGVKILYGLTQTETIIQCKNIIICAGPWTSKVFRSLFPLSTASVDISSLAGYSLVLRSPRHTVSHERDLYHGHSHAIFTTHPSTAGFSTEIFSREGGEIFIAGLNSSQIPLPDQPEGAGAIMDKKSIEELKAVAIRLLGKLRDGEVESTDEIPNLDDLELVREGLCFRPVPSISGRPVIVTQVMDELLGPSYQSNGSGIGRDKGGVFIAAGHGPWGISLSLGTGKVVADLVDGVEPGADIEGLAL